MEEVATKPLRPLGTAELCKFYSYFWEEKKKITGSRARNKSTTAMGLARIELVSS